MPYDDVTMEVWALMYQLPFRVKYEVSSASYLYLYLLYAHRVLTILLTRILTRTLTPSELMLELSSALYLYPYLYPHVYL